MPDTRELERRMRPGAWSESGFLGLDEKLEDVLARDRQTLLRLGVTREELAEDLALLIDAPELVPPRGPHKQELGEIQQRRMESQPARRDHLTARFGSLDGGEFGWTARVGRRYEIEITMYLGIQQCPWSQGETLCGAASTDWLIRDTERGLELGGPTLITHLIQEHGFFEGVLSTYRVDPDSLTELLMLGPYRQT